MVALDKITGPIHPLVAHLRREHARRAAAVARWQATAQAILRHQHLTATTDQGVYEVGGPGSWRYVGPVEDHGQLATQAGYVAITARGGFEALAVRLSDIDGYGLAIAERLHEAAHAAAPMVAAVIGLRVMGGTLEWDTGETVSEAALRLARDAAWEIYRGPSRPALCGPDPGGLHAGTRLVYDVAAAMLSAPQAEQVAQNYLDRRGEVTAAVAAAGIQWGGAQLTARQAAERARIAVSTWHAYVSRRQVPEADDGEADTWRTTTVDAYRLTRTRTRCPAGW